MAAGSEPIAEMLLTLSVASAAILGGTLATYLYDDHASLSWRLCAGACTGLVAIGIIGFCLASWFGLTLLTSILAAGLAASPLVLLSTKHRRAQLRADVEAAVAATRALVLNPTRRAVLSSTLSLVVVLLVWRVVDRVAFERPDGLYTGVANNSGDLSFHLGVITRFVLGENFPPEHPVYAGVRFTYSFLADLVAAMFVSTGMSLRGAMLVQNFVLAISLIVLLHRWSLDLTRERSAAVLTPALYLLSGGLGWWLLVPELARSEGGMISLLTHLPHDYTIKNGTDWRWGNMVTALLVPQRSILLGLPVAIIIFTLWWRSFEDPTSSVRRRMVAAGVLTGLLPLVHAHTYAVVMAMGGCLGTDTRPVPPLGPVFRRLARDQSAPNHLACRWHVGPDRSVRRLAPWLGSRQSKHLLVLAQEHWGADSTPRGCRPLARPQRTCAAAALALLSPLHPLLSNP